MSKKIVAYTNKNGKLCQIVSNGEEITVEETAQESIE